MGAVILILIISVAAPLLLVMYLLQKGGHKPWMVALIVVGAFVAGFVQFFGGFLILMGTKGDFVAAMLPSILTGVVIALCRRKLWTRFAGIAVAIACLIYFLPPGTFGGRVSFTEMPIQRYETDSTLSESVLIKNHPKDSLALRDLMVGYFDSITRGHEKPGDISIWFFEDNRYTRVFIDNEQDPYDFARVYLGSDDRYTLGYVSEYTKDGVRRKEVNYRTARSGEYDPRLREELIWKQPAQGAGSVYMHRFFDGTFIGKAGRNMIESEQYLDSKGCWMTIRFYTRTKARFSLCQQFSFEQILDVLCDPLIEDINGDGYEDFSYCPSPALGANEIRNIFIYSAQGDSLIYIKNSKEYPNLQYGYVSDCITSFSVHSGCTTYFHRIEGDSLRPVASVELLNGRLTVTEFDSEGRKIILRDEKTDKKYSRAINYNQLEWE